MENVIFTIDRFFQCRKYCLRNIFFPSEVILLFVIDSYPSNETLMWQQTHVDYITVVINLYYTDKFNIGTTTQSGAIQYTLVDTFRKNIQIKMTNILES